MRVATNEKTHLLNEPRVYLKSNGRRLSKRTTVPSVCIRHAGNDVIVSAVRESVCIVILCISQGYRLSAERASILFFVLNDMGAIDPMYQFSLDAYTDLFNLSIDKSQRSQKLEDRITNLNEYHTYAVYR